MIEGIEEAAAVAAYLGSTGHGSLNGLLRLLGHVGHVESGL